MNTQPGKAPFFPVHLLQRIWQTLYRNWPWKLLALLLSICMWVGLILQDPTLVRERVFTDVPLNVTGADTLRRNSSLIVVSGLESENLNARLRVEVPQREYSSASYSNYNPRLDLTRITGAGEQTLRVVTTSSTTYGSVQDVSPSTVTVMVEEYVTNYRVPVSVNVIGDYPEGFYGSAISLDPSIVTVSGPRSLVDEIVRAVVDYDVSRLTARAGQVRTARTMKLLDRDGREIVSDLVEVTSANIVLRTIVLEQTLYPTRSFAISTEGLTTGTPALGYRIANVSIEPSTLNAAGDEEVLAGLESLFVSTPVDVSGKTESFTQTVRGRKPSSLAYLSSDTITVTVEIEPVIISRTFGNTKLSVRGTGSGLKASANARSISMILTGPQQALKQLRTGQVVAWVDVTGLEAGEYTLPVQLHLEEADASGITFEATPATVTVTLSQK